jgi:hypothetical protein
MLRISQPRIISFVRLLGKLVIFRPLLEYCTLRGNQTPGSKLGQAFHGKIALRYQVPGAAGEAFSFPVQFWSDDFVYLR